MKIRTWTLDESPAQIIPRMIPQKRAGPLRQENSSDHSPNLREKHGQHSNFAADATSIIDFIDIIYLYAELILHRSPKKSGTQSAQDKNFTGKEKRDRGL